MRKLAYLLSAGLLVLGSAAGADPDKNESGKRYHRYEDRRGDDRWRDDRREHRDWDRDDDRREGRHWNGKDERGGRHYRSRHRVQVPYGHLPPPGSCRTWYPGVPAGHQPPPYNCRRGR